MKKADLVAIESQVMSEVVRRRHLGEYNPDAKAILLLCESVMRMATHLADEMPDAVPTKAKK